MTLYNSLTTVFISAILCSISSAQIVLPYKQTADYPKSNVSYSDFEDLMKEVKSIRAKRLISFAQLKAFQADPNTVLLDARSRDRFASRHVKGAINLPYSEFTEKNLREIIPDVNTRVIIYCNNNFEGDEIDFASKRIVLTSKDIKRVYVNPPGATQKEIKKYKRQHKRFERKNRRKKAIQPKTIMLALNVPTYITLYGYGYRNICELGELVNVRDAKVDFEGRKNGLHPVGTAKAVVGVPRK